MSVPAENKTRLPLPAPSGGATEKRRTARPLFTAADPVAVAAHT